MRRVVQWLLVLLIVVGLAAGAGLTYLFIRYPAVPAAEAVSIEPTPERLACGAYLFNHVAVCVDCHSTRDWSKYGGPIKPGTEGQGGDAFTPEMLPGLPGSLYARNITPAGVGDWTDGELVRAITTGVNRRGEALFPLMPYQAYGQLDRADIEAIVAYVRTLRPIPNHVPERRVHFPVSLMLRTIPQPARFALRPSPADRVAYGEYLVRAAACAECHTPQENGQPRRGFDFAGGVEFRLPSGSVVRTANITPDADTGIGTWTEEQFVRKFKAFDGAPEIVLATEAEQRQNTAMPWALYGGMTEEDLGAIYAYLRTRAPVTNRVQPHAGAVAQR